jgi:hypothetical protein
LRNSILILLLSGMNRSVFFLFCFVGFINSFSILGQSGVHRKIVKLIDQTSVELPLKFLSSDDMRGRDTGSKEADLVAQYLANEFVKLGIRPVSDYKSYFQQFNIERTDGLGQADLQFAERNLKFQEDFVLLGGVSGQWSGEYFFAGYGTAAELNTDLKNKWVVAIAGFPGSTGRAATYQDSMEKLKLVQAAGGLGLLELVPDAIAWSSVQNLFSKTSAFRIQSKLNAVPHLWIKNTNNQLTDWLSAQVIKSVNLSISRMDPVLLSSQNVIGVLEGTDPELKKQFIAISAHYDHLGVGPKIAGDSIYNGARDNAVGVVTMLSAAKFFSKHRPKRSIIFLGFTAEERGLLGSKWYGSHPLIPMRQVVFNFNCDGAGYTDTSIITVIGINKSSAGELISRACETAGLQASTEPVFEKLVFAGTDAFYFINQRVPAVTICPGFHKFDAELYRFYHHPADEFSTLDFNYLIKYFRASVLSFYRVANSKVAPVWLIDPTEFAGK